MKKLLKALTLAVLCIAVMSVSAMAAENITANNDGTFPAVFSDGTNGEYYALVVVKGIYTEGQTPAISQDTVLHIDQVTAGANGATFESFTPKTNDAATVYIGGSDIDNGPVILGYINAEPEVTQYKVSVAVTADSDAAATVVLTTTDGTFTAEYNEDSAKYEVEVAEGTYKLTVTVPKHLSYTKNELVVDADVEKAVTLKGGDVNESGVIDEVDLSGVLTDFALTESENDANDDGKVDELDLSIVLTNFSAANVVE